VRAWDPDHVMASHPWLGEDDKTRKRPLRGMPTISVSNHQRVNLYLRVVRKMDLWPIYFGFWYLVINKTKLD
jgi:hypothetical protein